MLKIHHYRCDDVNVRGCLFAHQTFSKQLFPAGLLKGRISSGDELGGWPRGPVQREDEICLGREPW